MEPLVDGRPVEVTPAIPGVSTRSRQTLAVTLLFVVLTAVMTWPQVRFLSTHSREHQDVYFNMWRLRWVAHALATDPAGVFDANIFHPERRTLTYSDAMPVEGVVAAPLLWAGLPPVLVHNLLLLGAIVASATGMFVLARALTGCAAAGVVAAIVFAFAPYRFEHYMHMELQWTMWMPWTFWALQRTLETARPRFGLLTGVFVALQMLSSVYYGIFLCFSLAIAGGCLLVAHRRQFVPVARALLPGVIVAVIVCGAYALPYVATSREVGSRSDHEISMFSARPSSYLVATPDNVMWGHAFAGRGRAERRLFPGALAVLLALAGLLVKRPSAVSIAYLLALAAAYELSLGFSGFSYRWLYEHVPIFQGLRAIARAGIFVVFFLSALAAVGCAALTATATPRVRRAFAAAVCAVLLLEYRVRPLELTPFPNGPSTLGRWLREQPPGVVAELPMGVANALPGPEPRYSYLSSFHWKPIVNGYSGYYPQSYLTRVDVMSGFPDEASLARLRKDGVRYIVVHMEHYRAGHQAVIRETLGGRLGLPELARFTEGRADTIVWGLR
jgi:hypothetical protein